MYRLATHSCLAHDASVIVITNTRQEITDLILDDLSPRERIGQDGAVGLLSLQRATDCDALIEVGH